ncbi:MULTISPECIES: hypothetical protein [Arthrobacter]|uniref:Uncharacterized protein n=1 Tax=Arthrobacter terricola TaxID=2547396 RepID=A0A4R5KMQ5_9MICC|nr:MULTISPECIES: hypothetical protein [Arthrobacter]MBT8161042.1 hypothetical protein [Arthrobacter sp. GN70]TDF96901.1 hypothetical protein E1809_09270 [Arthrobacter terricola]
MTTPKVTELSRQLDEARAKLATLPKPGVLNALPWDTTDSRRAAAIIEAQALVTQLENLLAAAVRSTLTEIIDTVSAIPEDMTNFRLLRQSVLLLNALAKLEESLI